MRVKLRKTVFEELQSEGPDFWYLCEVRAPRGPSWIAAWAEKSETKPTCIQERVDHQAIAHWIATRLALEWLFRVDEELCYRQCVDSIQFVNSLVSLYHAGIGFKRSLRWRRELSLVEACQQSTECSWRASCLKFWLKKGSGPPDAFDQWTRPSNFGDNQAYEHNLSAEAAQGLSSPHLCPVTSRNGQDEVGKNEPPPKLEREWTKRETQEEAGHNKPPPHNLNALGAAELQDEVGQDEPPPGGSGVHGSNNRSRFTICSEEHPGTRSTSVALDMDVPLHSHDDFVEEDWIGWILRERHLRKSQYPLVAAAGAATWTSVRAAYLRPHATLGERMVFAQETEGWMASDEWAFTASRMRRAASQYHFLPVAVYSQVTDDFIFESDDVHVPNTGVSLLPILYGAHWIGVEIDKQHDMPEIAILQCAQVNQSRIETFVCHVLQIPAHRLVIQHWADTSPPHMCGWSLLWRWIGLSHSQQTFSRTLAEFQGLSDDRKRIISRVLDRSVEAWARTQADPDLQQVAYTVRQAFLVHLFQFNTSVHTRLDALSICAAGQPMSVFVPPHQQQQELLTQAVATQTHESREDTQVQVQEAEQLHSGVKVGVQTEFLGEETSNMTFSQSGPGLERTRARVQEFCIYPGLAASDELDHAIDICRHFTGHVNLLPCCIWVPDTEVFEVISNRRPSLFHHLEHRVLAMAHHHWFAVHILYDAGLVWVHIYGFPNSDHDEVPAFLRALANFLHIQSYQIRAHLFPYVCPEAMCGFKMLQGCFDAMDIAFMPACEESVHALQAHAWADDFGYIGHHAVRMWRHATSDNALVSLAFAVRTLFLANLLQTQWVDRHVRGGGPDVSWSPGQSLPPLKPDTRKCLQEHVRTHRPVIDLCACKTKAFSAQAITGPHVQKWNELELVACRIVTPATGLRHDIGDLDCSWPECAHARSTFAHLSLPGHVWHMLGPDKPIYIIEARLLWIDNQCIIDVRAPQAGIFPVHSAAFDGEGQIRVGEFFGGGFSGWSFPAKFLKDALLPIKGVFSIENDIIAARVHARNHSNFPPITSAAQAIGFGQSGEPPKEPLTVVANIEHSWWCHLFEQIDILVASPPCQPWSRAGAERGLDSEEGRLLIYTVTQCIFLRPAVLCLEEVASVFAHKHAPWLLAVIHWAGYEIIWKENLNLLEVLPNHAPGSCL